MTPGETWVFIIMSFIRIQELHLKYPNLKVGTKFEVRYEWWPKKIYGTITSVNETPLGKWYQCTVMDPGVGYHKHEALNHLWAEGVTVKPVCRKIGVFKCPE